MLYFFVFLLDNKQTINRSTFFFKGIAKKTRNKDLTVCVNELIFRARLLRVEQAVVAAAATEHNRKILNDRPTLKSKWLSDLDHSMLEINTTKCQYI